MNIYWPRTQAQEGDLLRKKSGFTKKDVLDRDGYKCHYCRGVQTKTSVTMDHVVARHRGGPFIADNLVPSCRKCNARKADKVDPDHCAFCAAAVAKYPPLPGVK